MSAGSQLGSDGESARGPGTGYDKARSIHTTLYLTAPALEKVRQAAREFDLAEPRRFPQISCLSMVDFVVLTGAHPEVLSRPQSHGLRTTTDGGYLWVAWSRPKKAGLGATMNLPVAKAGSETAATVRGFVDSLNAGGTYVTRHLNYICAALSEASGVRFSLRSLRHTCGVQKAEASRDPAVVQSWLNCSPITAMQYLRLASSSDPRMLDLAVD